MKDDPRIVVFGSGAVGCFIGGAWLAAGRKVAFLGRERVRQEIADHGLGLSDQDGWRIHLAPELVDFTTKAAALKKADIILLTVKSTGTEATAKEIARHARPGTTVISFQNGISNAETLKRLLPRFDVVQGMVPYNVVRTGAGRWHRATWGDLTAAESEATRALAARIGDRPGKLLLARDMLPVAWGKLLLNLNNAINALSGLTILEELNQRDYRRVLAAAMIETLELLQLAGIEPVATGPIPPRLLPHAIGAPDFVFRNFLLRVQKIDPKARSSMSEDLAAGRETEVDYLNGEVVKLARSLGREAPVNSHIVDLVKQAEMGINRTWSAAELRAHILEGHQVVRGFGY
ncbi:2-dehydropantoate 2-reductase [Sphingosinicella humi]|uniref:2-dehydropantoate 2-reductase n=1 Tax=Allosphingosinicella humi TaxID=2068657 RepID=A0A2U2J0M3_9SPHN|nr:2-dehydropantoate 2-reductase [Sphingosinicella humi]PWG01890.1 2-dehydropantoate 2-reductase [Sphingosinicella humi]